MIKLGLILPLGQTEVLFSDKNGLSMWKDISSDNDTIELTDTKRTFSIYLFHMILGCCILQITKIWALLGILKQVCVKF